MFREGGAAGGQPGEGGGNDRGGGGGEACAMLPLPVRTEDFEAVNTYADFLEIRRTMMASGCDLAASLRKRTGAVPHLMPQMAEKKEEVGAGDAGGRQPQVRHGGGGDVKPPLERSEKLQLKE